MKSKLSLLYFNNEAWVKKSNSTFDVTMGSFDGAESCDICGLFLLSKLQHLSIVPGLYRDDGLAISNLSPRDTENTKKNICEIFKEYNLSITIEANLKVVNFLDVQLDLEKGTFKPFAKPNDKLNYVNSQSNHPPGIIKNIPKSVNKRLSKLSATKEVFDEAAKSYQDELNEKGYKYKLEYEATTKTAKKRRNRSRNVTYFNPPYSKSVKTNVGAKFLAIISKNFPAKHPLHKILNRSTVKIGYRCMPNIKACIDKHNMQVLRQDDQVQTGNGCNCLVSRKADCPIPGKCATESVIYRASVRRYDTCTVDCYTGLTGDKFKTRYTQHQSDIRTRLGLQCQTPLSS